MGFFTTRERDALGRSAETRPPGKVREFVRHDFAPRRRPGEPDLAGQRRPPEPDLAGQRRPAEPDLAGHLHSLMQRVTDTSVHQIDDLIADLRRRREELLNETARVQRQIIEYAKLNQSTMQSNKIITESLANLNKVLVAPNAGVHESEEEISSDEDADDAGEAFAPEQEQEQEQERDQPLSARANE